MVISQVINSLTKHFAEHGDLPVYVGDNYPFDDTVEISGVKYLDAQDKLSACCGEPPKGEIHDGLGICSNENCREHVEFEGLPERIWLKQ